MANQVISSFKETAESITAATRAWGEFLDLSAFRIPSSVADATTRVRQNLTHFRVKYSIFLCFLLSLALTTSPIAVLVFIAVGLVGYFLYFTLKKSLVIFGFSVNDGVVTGFLAGVFFRAPMTVEIGVLIVFLHAALRGTEDLVTDDLESPYGAMLSPVAGENGGARGDYTGL